MASLAAEVPSSDQTDDWWENFTQVLHDGDLAAVFGSIFSRFDGTAENYLNGVYGPSVYQRKSMWRDSDSILYIGFDANQGFHATGYLRPDMENCIGVEHYFREVDEYLPCNPSPPRVDVFLYYLNKLLCEKYNATRTKKICRAVTCLEIIREAPTTRRSFTPIGDIRCAL